MSGEEEFQARALADDDQRLPEGELGGTDGLELVREDAYAKRHADGALRKIMRAWYSLKVKSAYQQRKRRAEERLREKQQDITEEMVAKELEKEAVDIIRSKHGPKHLAMQTKLMERRRTQRLMLLDSQQTEGELGTDDDGTAMVRTVSDLRRTKSTAVLKREQQAAVMLLQLAWRHKRRGVFESPQWLTNTLERWRGSNREITNVCIYYRSAMHPIIRAIDSDNLAELERLLESRTDGGSAGKTEEGKCPLHGVNLDGRQAAL